MAVREYFYGKPGGTSYFPFSFDVPFSEVQIYKIGGVKWRGRGGRQPSAVYCCVHGRAVDVI